MTFDILLDAFDLVLDFSVLLCLFGGVFLGVLVGALPGLGTITALAMILPFTFVLDAPQAFALLLSVYCSSVYGGSISALLINVPGTPQSAATVLDGYPMARKGLAAEALGWSTTASTIGGVFSLIILMIAAPQLAAIALEFGPIEIFALIVFSLTTIAWVSRGTPVKGLLGGILGLFMATVGIDQMSGVQRFTFDVFSLSAGFNLVSVLIGLFALSEVFYQAAQKSRQVSKPIVSVGFKLAPFGEWWIRSRTLLRSCFIGTFLGVLPGVGAAVASLIGYAQARMGSPRKSNFGKGEPEGIIASEAANNAVTGGALVPTLALGIPGDGGTAVMLGALIVHGITPGARLFSESPDLVASIFVALLFANLMMFVAGMVCAHLFSRVVATPTSVVMAVVVALSLAGAYVIRNSFLDVVVAVVVGIIGLLLRYNRFPLAPIVIGFILGPTFEESFRQGLIITRQNVFEFFAQPIAACFFTLTILVMLYPLIAPKIRSLSIFNKGNGEAGDVGDRI